MKVHIEEYSITVDGKEYWTLLCALGLYLKRQAHNPQFQNVRQVLHFHEDEYNLFQHMCANHHLGAGLLEKTTDDIDRIVYARQGEE